MTAKRNHHLVVCVCVWVGGWGCGCGWVGGGGGVGVGGWVGDEANGWFTALCMHFLIGLV